MKEKNKYTMSVVREGLTQYKFEGHGYTLSVGSNDDIHYCSSHQGTVEIAVLDEHGHFVPLTRHDDVAGYIPREQVDGLLRVLETVEHPPFRYFHHKYENVLDD